jgi:hypothetical protein
MLQLEYGRTGGLDFTIFDNTHQLSFDAPTMLINQAMPYAV